MPTVFIGANLLVSIDKEVVQHRKGQTVWTFGPFPNISTSAGIVQKLSVTVSSPGSDQAEL